MRGNWVCLLGTLMALTTPLAQADYKSCDPPPPPGASTNIADPMPEGRVDNAAPAAVGTALPQTGPYLGNPPIIQPDDRGIYYNLKWGEEFWEEPTRNCLLTYQLFDFQPAKDYNPNVTDNKLFPVIVYFHPNGEVHRWENDSLIEKTVATKARNENYHFISVEYRHPVSDQYLQDDPLPNFIPHDDVGLFIEYLKSKAGYLKLDARNIFVFGRSRGALALWDALNANRILHPTRQVRGFVGYAAQTSYQCDKFGDQFLKDPKLQEWKDFCKSHNQNRHDSHFKNAVDEVFQDTNLYVMLQYEHEFRMVGSEILKITPESYLALPFNEQLHYPNFGKALQIRYQDFGRGSLIETEDKVPSGEQFRGWFQFVNPRKAP
jgi:acetyl esterase/lipase